MPPRIDLNKYIHAKDISKVYPNRKTKTFIICNSKSEVGLGVVKWYSPWRQYCFFPSVETIFNNLCLQSVAQFCETLTIKEI